MKYRTKRKIFHFQIASNTITVSTERKGFKENNEYGPFMITSVT